MSPFNPLLAAAHAQERGPLPSFTPAHFILAFLVIGDSGTIGRHALAKEADLGDGAVRTVLQRLRRMGYIRVGASGCTLSSKGKLAYDRIRQKVTVPVDLGHSSLTMGAKQTAIEIRGAGAKTRDGIEQRDAAVRVGALGATTYVIQGSRFTVPGGSSDCETDFPSPVWNRLKLELRPRDGDAIIVCGSDAVLNSILGALSASLTLQ